MGWIHSIVTTTTSTALLHKNGIMMADEQGIK